MPTIIQHTKKHRREIIVNKLIAFDIYDREDEQLYQIPVTRLENEYKRFLNKSHPHDGFGSLRISWKRK